MNCNIELHRVQKKYPSREVRNTVTVSREVHNTVTVSREVHNHEIRFLWKGRNDREVSNTWQREALNLEKSKTMKRKKEE